MKRKGSSRKYVSARLLEPQRLAPLIPPITLFLFLLLTALCPVHAQDAPAQTKKVTTKTDKKAAKAEKKVHDKSKKEMEKQTAKFHKKKYGDIPKAKKQENTEK